MTDTPLSDDKRLVSKRIDSPLGPMILVADERYLYCLEFEDRKGLKNRLNRLKKRLKAVIIPGETQVIHQAKEELAAYFQGTRIQFKTPCCLLGTAFQQSVWKALQTIPSGETRSYLDIATAIGRATSYRAVANANGANPVSIIVPCHRVINHDGALGGYGGGLSRKTWLLKHEKHLKSGVAEI